MLDYVTEHPEQHDQAVWIERQEVDNGTADEVLVGCFASWTCMLAGDAPYWLLQNDDATARVVTAEGETFEISWRARELLELEYDGSFAGHKLFTSDLTLAELPALVEFYFGPRGEEE